MGRRPSPFILCQFPSLLYIPRKPTYAASHWHYSILQTPNIMTTYCDAHEPGSDESNDGRRTISTSLHRRSRRYSIFCNFRHHQTQQLCGALRVGHRLWPFSVPGTRFAIHSTYLPRHPANDEGHRKPQQDRLGGEQPFPLEKSERRQMHSPARADT